MTTPKKFQISIDAGVTYFTFPGDTADLNNDATNIRDTVFGQNWDSGQTGLITWTMQANGFYKGFAGYVAQIKKSGTSTVMTAEPTTSLAARIYQITNVAHQVIDRNFAPVVKDNAIDQTANVLSIDYLWGIVTFKNTYTVVTPVTIDGHYWPMTQIAKGQSFTLTQTAGTIETTDFPTAQGNGGFKTMTPGLNKVDLEVGGVYAITNAWLAALTSRNELMIEITPDGAESAACRGIYKVLSEGQAGKVGELEKETIKFTLAVPDPSNFPLLTSPFSWRFANNSTLSVSLQNALSTWQNSIGTAQFNYLYDGINGHTGTGVITDMTLKGGLDVMNEFSIKVSGNGALAAVGTG